METGSESTLEDVFREVTTEGAYLADDSTPERERFLYVPDPTGFSSLVVPPILVVYEQRGGHGCEATKVSGGGGYHLF